MLMDIEWYIMYYASIDLSFTRLFDSFDTGRYSSKLVIFKLMSHRNILSIAREIALRWMALDLTDD